MNKRLIWVILGLLLIMGLTGCDMLGGTDGKTMTIEECIKGFYRDLGNDDYDALYAYFHSGNSSYNNYKDGSVFSAGLSDYTSYTAPDSYGTTTTVSAIYTVSREDVFRMSQDGSDNWRILSATLNTVSF